MAASNFIVVSSSPPRVSKFDIAGMSSSPGLPSPRALVRPKNSLRASSKQTSVVEAPKVMSCTRATDSVWEIPDDHPRTVSDASKETISKKPAKLYAPRKLQTKKNTGGQEEPVTKKPRKARAKKSDLGNVNVIVSKEEALSKPRKMKKLAESQSKISRGRVTKTLVGSGSDKSKVNRKTDVVSGHFTSAVSASAGHLDGSEESSNDLLLQEAVRRRINWTPPRAVALLADIATASTAGDTGLDMLTRAELQSTNQLDLMGRFGYNSDDQQDMIETRNKPFTIRKRKLIELVKTNAPPILLPEKSKAVKKKARTITELATSAYVVNESDAIATPLPAPLLQYFAHENQKGVEIGIGVRAGSKSRSRSPVKSSKSSKAKKDAIEAPILLSPETALKRSAKQEFVFGTSSQLARENSPTLLRDLHQAMKESNRIKDDLFVDLEDRKSPESSSLTGRGTDLYKTKRNLWGEASLGAEREDILTIDLSQSPETSKLTVAQLALSRPSKATTGPVFTAEKDEWHELDEGSTPVQNEDNIAAALSPKIVSMESNAPMEILHSSERVKPNSPIMSTVKPQSSIKSSMQLNNREKEHHVIPKPDYGSYPTTQLAKEIESYHFKSIKSRDQMIALLERCWESKQRITLGNLETNRSLVSQAAYSTKPNGKATAPKGVGNAPRGRPRKDSSSQTSPTKTKARAKSPRQPERGASAGPEIAKPLVLRQTPKKQLKRSNPVEEIYDSDTSLSSSPPRRSPSKIRSPAPPLQLSTSPSFDNDNDSSSTPIPTPLSPSAQQVHLQRHITRAILSAPPSTNAKQPSWHEKILLYDPIVLEDLTAWLNTSGALQRVGWDGEVAPKEVKAWCLAKSVCCLWRENLRGGARSRY